MNGNNRKWSALFVLLIAVPAGFLTYLSARSFRSEQRAALSAINLLVPELQLQLDRLLANLATAALEHPITTPLTEGMQIPGVEFRFLLDERGALQYPRHLPLILTERSPGFAAAIEKAELLEFQEGDFEAAIDAYDKALNLAEHPREEAESLNGLARLRAAQGLLAEAREVHDQLRAHAVDLADADGAHPLSMSYVRLAGRLPPEEALAVLQEWVGGLLKGQYPVISGIELLLERAEKRARNLKYLNRATAESLIGQIDRARRLAARAETFTSLVSSGVLTGRTQTLSGVGPYGASFLLHVRRGANGQLMGVFYELNELAVQLSQSPPGLELESQGFGIELFDVDDTARFELKNREGTRQVASASRSIYRLSMGIFALNQAFVLRNYRNRNLFTLAGIFLLAGVIAGGALLIFRDTGRQLHTARLRAEFVANVSHELRTPLTAIRMYAETLLLERYRGREQLREYLGIIMQESQRLSRMVGNVLDFSRMESGRKTYDFVELDLGAVVRNTLEEFRPVLNQGGFVLALQIPESPPAVRGDGEAIATAVANLMSNAVKYSKDRKEIGVTVAAVAGAAQVEIADRGVGISSEEQTRIFEKFHRAPSAGNTATGTGLGLALVKGIAEAHGGSIDCRSRKGGGTAFALRLPLTET